MKTLKVLHIITIVLSCAAMLILFPFLYIAPFGTQSETNYKVVAKLHFNFGDGIFKTLTILLIVFAVLMIICSFIALLTNKKIQILFIVGELVFAGTYLGLATYRSFASVYFAQNFMLLIPTMFIMLLDATLTLIIFARSTVPVVASMGVAPHQSVTQPMGDSDQPHNINGGQSLTDSVQLKERIKNLKSGLTMTSYDDVLQQIESTGEWQGLNMKDVVDYDYEKAAKKIEPYTPQRNVTQEPTAIPDESSQDDSKKQPVSADDKSRIDWTNLN